jgi:hypothetical protein
LVAQGNRESRPSFNAVYDRLRAHGPGRATSRLGTEYRITAEVVKGRHAIIAWPRSSRITIHDDCWGEDTTCQRTRAGGIYNGPYSIYDWYWANA